jgi:hypothetical protein
MSITKYNTLTVEELLNEAYRQLTSEDELGLELMLRLQEVKDQLDAETLEDDVFWVPV